MGLKPSHLSKTIWARSRLTSPLFFLSHVEIGRRRWTFIIAAICGVVGVLVTYFFVPDKTGIDLADEDEKWLKYLADNGWEGDIGEEDEIVLAGDREYDQESASDEKA